MWSIASNVKPFSFVTSMERLLTLPSFLLRTRRKLWKSEGVSSNMEGINCSPGLTDLLKSGGANNPPGSVGPVLYL